MTSTWSPRLCLLPSSVASAVLVCSASTASTRSSPISRSTLDPDRVRAEPLELALYARDAGVARGPRGRGVLPADGGPRSRARVRVAAPPRPAVRGAGERHRPRRRRDAARRPGRHRHHADEPHPRGRRRRARSRGSSPACSTSISRGRSRTSGCTTRPIRRRSRRARSAATSATNAGGPHCLRRASRRRTCSRSTSCSPTARSRGSAGSSPTSRATTCAGCFVGSEGTMGIATAIAVRLTARPAGDRARCCSTSPSIDDAAADGERDHRRRDRPGRARDDGRARSRARSRTSSAPGYPRDAAAVLLVELDGLARRRRPRRSKWCARFGPRARRAHGAGRGRRRRARLAVEGPQVGVRRDRAHRARLLPARRGGARARSSSTCCSRSTRSPTSSGSR